MGKRRDSIDRIQRKRKKRQKELRLHIVLFFVFIGIIIGFISIIRSFKKDSNQSAPEQEIDWTNAPPIDVELLTVNEYSRPGISLNQVNGIVIHYTANPGATAINNRDYFEGLKDSHTTKVSSHFIVGLEGEIVQCIPTTEISYASNDRNSDTISIECCHPDETGKFNDATYQSLVELTAWLCERFGLNVDNVIRHYDVTGKNCPKYFVENESAWEKFKEDVSVII